ncbi:MAG: copper resistance D family protein [Rhodothermales bacterium]
MLDWDIWLLSSVVAKLFIYMTSFLAVGSLMFLWLLKPETKAIRRQLFKIVIWAALFSILLTLLRISLQAGQLYDEGFIGMIDADMVQIVTEGPLGNSSYLRIAGLALLIMAVFLSGMQVPLTIVGGLAVAASFALIGHATREPILLGVLITIHLLAVSYWIGGLYPLYKLASDKSSLNEAGDIAHRFGQQAAMIVPVLIIVGVVFAIVLTGSPLKLIGTEYGLILVLKIMLVAVLLGLAAFNKLKFVPKLQNLNEDAAHHLRISIRLEFVAFVLIFVLTAVLTSAVNLPDM